MGPWTRTIRVVFAAAFGAMAGFIVSPVVNVVLHGTAHSVLGQRPAATDFGVVVMVALMVVGSLVGALVGAAGRRKTYHDES